jgi:hypothetical protein
MASITYAYWTSIVLPIRTSEVLWMAGITNGRWATAREVLWNFAAVFQIALTNIWLLLGADKWTLRASAFKKLCGGCPSEFGVPGDLLAYSQSGFGLLLIFLIGLGLRNRFRVGGSGG